MPSIPLPPVRPIGLTLGGPVSLDDVVGREDVIASWWEALNTRSLRITEPRRFGKTTTLQLMTANPPPGWVVLMDTVQDAHTAKDLIEHTLGLIGSNPTLAQRSEAILGKFGRFVQELLPDGLTAQIGIFSFKLDSDFARDPMATFEHALKDVYQELEENNQRLVIIWDEFTDCLRSIRDNKEQGPNVAAQTLEDFRAMRERVCGQRIRWILCGSVGLHHILRSLPANGGVNDISSVVLGPLPPDAATWLARSLLLGQGWPDSPADAAILVEAANGIPYVLELIIDQIGHPKVSDASSLARNGLPSSVEEARELLIRAAANMDAGAGMVPLLERIGTYYDDWRLARAILDSLARQPLSLEGIMRAVSDITTDEEMVRSTIDLLKEDRYILFDRAIGTYAWLYSALRDIWAAKRDIV